MNQLWFNPDGTIDPAQLDGMPPEVVERVTSPEFIAQARAQIQFRIWAGQLRELAHAHHQARRPDEISGRQRKRLRRIARKLGNATMQTQINGEGQ